jgi:hypothetical protein
MTMDGSPVSEADVARIEAEEQMHAQWRRRTVRVVASAATDATDCRMLLSILGLEEDVEAARADAAPRPAKRRRRAHAAA